MRKTLLALTALTAVALALPRAAQAGSHMHGGFGGFAAAHGPVGLGGNSGGGGPLPVGLGGNSGGGGMGPPPVGLGGSFGGGGGKGPLPVGLGGSFGSGGHGPVGLGGGGRRRYLN